MEQNPSHPTYNPQETHRMEELIRSNSSIGKIPPSSIDDSDEPQLSWKTGASTV